MGKQKTGKVRLGFKLDPKRLFRKSRPIVLQVGLSTTDTIRTKFCPITKLEDWQRFNSLFAKIQAGDSATLMAIADDPELQAEFEPLFKKLCPELTKVGSWAELNPEAKLTIMDELYKDEGGVP